MKILLDMDEVIENMTHHWVDTLNCLYGLSVDFEDVNEWDMTKAYPTLDEESIYNPLHLETFWNGVELLDGAKEGIDELLSQGHEIYILTSSHPDTVALKAKWLSEHLTEIPWRNVIVARDKSMVKGDIIIDDGLHNMYGDHKYKIIFNKPWNTEYDKNTSLHTNEIVQTCNIKRANDWTEILQIIDDIK